MNWRPALREIGSCAFEGAVTVACVALLCAGVYVGAQAALDCFGSYGVAAAWVTVSVVVCVAIGFVERVFAGRCAWAKRPAL